MVRQSRFIRFHQRRAAQYDSPSHVSTDSALRECSSILPAMLELVHNQYMRTDALQGTTAKQNLRPCPVGIYRAPHELELLCTGDH